MIVTWLSHDHSRWFVKHIKKTFYFRKQMINGLQSVSTWNKISLGGSTFDRALWFRVGLKWTVRTGGSGWSGTQTERSLNVKVNGPGGSKRAMRSELWGLKKWKNCSQSAKTFRSLFSILRPGWSCTRLSSEFLDVSITFKILLTF